MREKIGGLGVGDRVIEMDRLHAHTLEDVGDLGGVGVAGERHAAGGERELGGADGGDAEHGQLGRAPLVVGAALAAVRLRRLPRGEIHRHRREKEREHELGLIERGSGSSESRRGGRDEAMWDGIGRRLFIAQEPGGWKAAHDHG